MKRRVIITCLTLSCLFGSSTTLQAQSSSYHRHHHHRARTHYARRDGKAQTIKRTGIGAGAGAAVGALAGGGKGAAIGAAAGGAGGLAYDQHKKHQEKKAYSH